MTEAEAGQVVARPVSLGNGMVLLQVGATLTRDLIDRLTGLGVEAVWVEGLGPDSRTIDEQLADLEARFIGHEQDELMQQLKQVVASRIRQGGTDRCDG